MATTVRPLAPAEEGAWNDFARAHPRSTVFHRAEWRRVVREATGLGDRYRAAWRDGRIVGILPLIAHRTLLTRFLVTSVWVDGEGLVAADAEAERALLDDAIRLTREENFAWLELRNYTRVASDDLALLPDYRTYLLRLSVPAATIWRRIETTMQQKIRKAEREGLEVVEGPEHLDAYYEVFAENMRDLGTPVFPRRYFTSMFRHLGDAARLLVVRRGETVLGGGILLVHRDTAYWPFSSSSRRWFSLAPNPLLYWRALGWALDHDLRVFDFGRSKQGSGTARFKKGFGARPRALSYQFYLHRVAEIPRIDPDNPRYRGIIAVWKRVPLWVQKAAGPHLIRYIA